MELSHFARRFKDAAVLTLRRSAHEIVKRLVDTVETYVRENSPVGAGDRGHIRDALNHEIFVRGFNVIGIVRPAADQAARYTHIEFGTAPHFPPIGPLLNWATVVLGDPSAAFAVQKHVARFGTPAHSGMLYSAGVELKRIVEANDEFYGIKVSTDLDEMITTIEG